MRMRLGMAALVCAGLIFAARPASAAPIIFSLNDPNPAVAGFPVSFGGVVVNLTTPNTATILFTANESHPNAITFGAESAVNLNVNASGFSISPVTETNSMPGFTPQFDHVSGLGVVDGRGLFNLQLTNFDGFPHSARTIAFTLVNTSGTWATSGDVLVSNALGNAVAAHVFVCAFGVALCNSHSGALATGYVADGPTGKPTQFCTNPEGCDVVTAVPEPASLMLLGTGLFAGAGAVRRRIRNKKLAA